MARGLERYRDDTAERMGGEELANPDVSGAEVDRPNVDLLAQHGADEATVGRTIGTASVPSVRAIKQRTLLPTTQVDGDQPPLVPDICLIANGVVARTLVAAALPGALSVRPVSTPLASSIEYKLPQLPRSEPNRRRTAGIPPTGISEIKVVVVREVVRELLHRYAGNPVRIGVLLARQGS